jgi:hypothetical protein
MQHTLQTVSHSWRSDAEILTDGFKCCYCLKRQADSDSHRQVVACGAAAATSEWLMGQTAMYDDVRMLHHLVDGRTDRMWSKMPLQGSGNFAELYRRAVNHHLNNH